MKPCQGVLLWFLVLSSLTGCGFSESKKEAVKTMDAVYESIRKGDYEAALDHYGEAFLKKMGRTTWKSTLQDVQRKLGDLESWQATSWHVEKRMGEKSITRVKIAYEVQYTLYRAKERVILERVGKSDFRIVEHRIRPRKLKNKDKRVYI